MLRLTWTMDRGGSPALAAACISIRATSKGWFQQASAPPMMPDHASSATVSLAFLSPWNMSLKRSRTASVNPCRDAQLVACRKAMAVPPG
jgi:hypothetical protein